MPSCLAALGSARSTCCCAALAACRRTMTWSAEVRCCWLTLIPNVPAVGGRAFAAQYAAQHDIAAAREAYPCELDYPAAAALVGALGAIAAALHMMLVRAHGPRSPEVIRASLADAVAHALGGQGRSGIGRKNSP